MTAPTALPIEEVIFGQSGARVHDEYMAADLDRSGLTVDGLPPSVTAKAGCGDHPIATKHPSLVGAPWYRIWYGPPGVRTYYADRIDTTGWEPSRPSEEAPGKYHAKAGPAELLVVTPNAQRAGHWWLVEGVKKALKWHKETGLPTIAFPGCDMLLTRNMRGQKKKYTPRKLIAEMARRGATFTVLFDADLRTNPNVHRAAHRAHEAGLRVLVNPTPANGIDDLIVESGLTGEALVETVNGWDAFDPARHTRPAAFGEAPPRFWENHWHVAGIGQFINTRALEWLTTSAFDVRYAHLVPIGTTATTVFKRQPEHKADRVDFSPDHDEVYVENGLITLNLFRKSNVVAKRGDVGFLHAHLAHLFCGRADDIRRMLRWFYVVCVTPGKKLRWMPLLCSADGQQGTGRGSLIAIAHRVLGNRLFGVAPGEHFAGRFTSFLLGKTLVSIPELEVSESKRDAYAHVKALITDDYLLMDEKGLREHTIRNLVNFIAASNSDWPIALAKHDRRVWAVETTAEKMPDRAAFHAWLARDETPGAVLWYLMNHVKKPDDAFLNDEPPMTTLKEEIITRSRPQIEVAFAELVESRRKPFDRELFLFDDVRLAIRDEAGLGDRYTITNAFLSSLLKKHRYARIEKQSFSRHRYWVREADRARLAKLAPKILDERYAVTRKGAK